MYRALFGLEIAMFVGGQFGSAVEARTETRSVVFGGSLAFKPQFQHVCSPYCCPYTSYGTSWENLLTHHDTSSLSPNINMHILLTVLHIFLMVLVGRICSHIMTPHL